MLIGWKKDQFELLSTEHGLFSLLVKLLDRSLGLIGWFSYIYDPSSNRGKDEFQTELFDLGNLTKGAWRLGGEFNEVLYSEDKNGRRNSDVQIRKLHKWVTNFALIDIPIKKQQYTLSNLRLQGKIYRFFAFIQWLDTFPNTSLKGLPMPGFKPLLLLLDMDLSKAGPTPLRFENMWLWHRSFKQKVKEWQEEYVLARWARLKLRLKLKNLKIQLRQWNRETFGNSYMEKDQLLQQIQQLDKEEEGGAYRK